MTIENTQDWAEVERKAREVEPSPKRFKINDQLTVQFKHGSMWIRQEQRYGEIEIDARTFEAMKYLADKHTFGNHP